MAFEEDALPSYFKRRGETLFVPVRVLPRSNRNELILADDGLRVRLTAPPVEGAANEALIGLLAECLSLPKRAICVARGAAGRQKLIEITGLSAEACWKRLRQSASEA